MTRSVSSVSASWDARWRATSRPPATAVRPRRRARSRRSSIAEGAVVCTSRQGSRPEGRHRHHHGARHARRRGGAVRRRTASRRGSRKGKIVVDMSSISPIETKEFAEKIDELGCDYLDAPVSGGEVGAKAATLTIMVGGAEARVRHGEAAVRADGQEHHAGRRQRRRPDHQGRQPDHRRADHRGGRRGAAVRVEGRRRSRPRCARR